MPHRAPRSPQAFTERLESVRNDILRHEQEIEKAAKDMWQLLSQTGCKQVLEKMLGGEVRFETTGPNAGKFLTEPFTLEDVHNLSEASGNDIPLIRNQIDSEETYAMGGLRTTCSYAIDPTQPDFFKHLENFLVDEKLKQLGATDQWSALYRQQKPAAQKEARKEVWRDLSPGMGRE